MMRVVIESPFAGRGNFAWQRWLDARANLIYARACLRDALLRGESPLASHALYTQPGVLNDFDPVERRLGMDAGHEWITLADTVAVYIDRGISHGMRLGMHKAKQEGVDTELRSLKGFLTPADRRAIEEAQWRMPDWQAIRDGYREPSSPEPFPPPSGF